ncbi:LacI family DNA-binding transcriptional regulator [Pedobacter sp. Du54]|uniref:LacI family DNA-binding transcriptional regulator n=1 Tax=Pedobacter anseongensis TaxID=3133439 RepID=UPI00309B3AF7
MNNSVTLRDIAKALNISASTVSRALTDSYQIGAATKKRVLDYAKQHHYVPNRMARGLKEGKSRSIGVVVCAIDNSFVAQMLNGIDDFYTAQGYQIIIMQSKESYEQELACIDLLYAGGIDGLLISPSYQTTDFGHLNELQRAGLPIVLFDRLSDGIETHKVAADHFMGAYQATTHLIKRGFKSIAHINSDTQLNMATARFEGYKKALIDAQLPIRDELIKFFDTTSVMGLTKNLKIAIEQLMSLAQKPDALFTATDSISTKCMVLLKKLNYSIPNDVGLIGFSNTDLAEALYIPMSTINQPAFEIGKLAAEKLLSLINSKEPEPFETVLLATELQERDSTFKG